MINPEDNVPLDDAQNSEADDQQSQKDIHSNGFDEAVQPNINDNASDTDRLRQASAASEASFTLNLDDAPKADE